MTIWQVFWTRHSVTSFKVFTLAAPCSYLSISTSENSISGSSKSPLFAANLSFLIIISSFYQSSNLPIFCLYKGPTEPPPPKPCKEHLDVGVIIDSSNSIYTGDYRTARQYIIQLAERLQISEAGTHMAILLYSWEAHTWHRLAEAV